MAMKLAADDPSPVSYWYTEADAAIALIRAEVLEEAAMECERMAKVFAPQQVITDRCAAAIRALKDKPHG